MFDKITPQIVNMINDLMDHRWQMQNKDASAEEDEYGYPFEPDNVISTEPLAFYESAMRLQTLAAELYSYVYKLNRHSPQFIKASSLLEKLVRQLGICCITVAALEQEGNNFSMLDGLTISWLRSITAFNVRKCYSAFMEQREIGVFRGHVTDLSIRWSALDKRLTATEKKIENIRNGSVRIAPFGDDRSSAGAISKESADKNDSGTSSVLSEARSFPVDKSVFTDNKENREPSGCGISEMINEPAGSEPVQETTDVQVPEPASVQTPADINNAAVSEDYSAPVIRSPENGPEPAGSDDCEPTDSELSGGVSIPDLSEWIIRRFIEKNFQAQNAKDHPSGHSGSAPPC